jgi:hypothetical protein
MKILVFLFIFFLASCGRGIEEYSVPPTAEPCLIEPIENGDFSSLILPEHDECLPWQTQQAELCDNEIDFSITRSINENLPPFVFRLLGGYRSYPPVAVSAFFFERTDPYFQTIDTIRVYRQGDLLQEIGGFFTRRYFCAMDPERDFGLHFADYNFDGFLDIAMHIERGGNRDAGDFYYWLWCVDTEQFIFHEQLSREMRGNGNIVSDSEYQKIYVWFSFAGGRHITAYEHENGVFTPVEITSWASYWTCSEEWNPPEGEFNVRIVQKCLITNTEEITYEYWEV